MLSGGMGVTKGEMVFEDRTDAGRRLAARLTAYAKQSDVVVLGIPRGGVVVAIGSRGAPRCAAGRVHCE